MGRLRLLADEHVPSVLIATLRSNGFDVATVQDRYGEGSEDVDILQDCTGAGLVILTNARDFVRIADETDHAGIIIYTDQVALLDDPLAAAEAIARMDRYHDPEEFAGVIEWLDNWRQ